MLKRVRPAAKSASSNRTPPPDELDELLELDEELLELEDELLELEDDDELLELEEEEDKLPVRIKSK